MQVDAGMMAAMMQNPPHIGTDSAEVEDVVQPFVNPTLGRNSVVVTVVRDIQQKEGLRDGVQEIEGDKLPGIRLECIKSNPARRQNRQPHCNFDPHRKISFGRNFAFGKEILEAAAQNFRKRRLGSRVEYGVPQGGLRWYKVIDLRGQTDRRLFGFTGTMISGRTDTSRPCLPNID